MAYTASGHPHGKPDVSGISITGTPLLHVLGPPAWGAANTQGHYIVQVTNANGTLRWLYDEPTPGVASRSTYLAY